MAGGSARGAGGSRAREERGGGGCGPTGGGGGGAGSWRDWFGATANGLDVRQGGYVYRPRRGAAAPGQGGGGVRGERRRPGSGSGRASRVRGVRGRVGRLGNGVAARERRSE